MKRRKITITPAPKARFLGMWYEKDYCRVVGEQSGAKVEFRVPLKKLKEVQHDAQ